MDTDRPVNTNLSSNLIGEVCVVIQDTGFLGSASDYVKKFYNKEFKDLTVCEAEMLVNSLKDKKGCLFNTREGNYDKA